MPLESHCLSIESCEVYIDCNDSLWVYLLLPPTSSVAWRVVLGFYHENQNDEPGPALISKMGVNSMTLPFQRHLTLSIQLYVNSACVILYSAFERNAVS